MVNLIHRNFRNLPAQGNKEIHDCADRGEIVDGDNRVHLVLGRAKQALDHGEADSLKDDAANLEEETNPHELDFTNRGNDDTDHNGGDIEEDLQAWLRDTQSPAREEDGDRGSGL